MLSLFARPAPAADQIPAALDFPTDPYARVPGRPYPPYPRQFGLPTEAIPATANFREAYTAWIESHWPRPRRKPGELYTEWLRRGGYNLRAPQAYPYYQELWNLHSTWYPAVRLPGGFFVTNPLGVTLIKVAGAVLAPVTGGLSAIAAQGAAMKINEEKALRAERQGEEAQQARRAQIAQLLAAQTPAEGDQVGVADVPRTSNAALWFAVIALVVLLLAK